MHPHIIFSLIKKNTISTLMSSIETVDYQPFFKNALFLRKLSFFFFKLNNQNRRLSGYSLFVIHMYFYVRYLHFMANISSDITVISITYSDDESEPDYFRSYNMVEVAQWWKLLLNINMKAWKYRENKLNQRLPVGKIISSRNNISNIDLVHLVYLDVENSWYII